MAIFTGNDYFKNRAIFTRHTKRSAINLNLYLSPGFWKLSFLSWKKRLEISGIPHPWRRIYNAADEHLEGRAAANEEIDMCKIFVFFIYIFYTFWFANIKLVGLIRNLFIWSLVLVGSFFIRLQPRQSALVLGDRWPLSPFLLLSRYFPFSRMLRLLFRWYISRSALPMSVLREMRDSLLYVLGNKRRCGFSRSGYQ